ncbi:D-lyxose/D-mannose family sugar isomerase [Corticicoccus populi]|uniref:D-lyxose ketol-isomerase n=1 Tax=Corticicoccus populi TaxID=1812821 RepID=A0ABW5WVF8_9STAP
MVTRQKYEQIRSEVLNYFETCNIVLNNEERNRIEVADFGLNRIEELGLQLIEYINTDRVCAKDLVLLPNQVCPEHRHPPVGDSEGKEETFRCRYGTVYLYVEENNGTTPSVTVPEDKKDTFTVNKEIVLYPGDQYTILPDTLHWFAAGKDGAVVSEFSTKSTDENDIFTDTEIKRLPTIEE